MPPVAPPMTGTNDSNIAIKQSKIATNQDYFFDAIFLIYMYIRTIIMLHNFMHASCQ